MFAPTGRKRVRRSVHSFAATPFGIICQSDTCPCLLVGGLAVVPTAPALREHVAVHFCADSRQDFASIRRELVADTHHQIARACSDPTALRATLTPSSRGWFCSWCFYTSKKTHVRRHVASAKCNPVLADAGPLTFHRGEILVVADLGRRVPDATGFVRAPRGGGATPPKKFFFLARKKCPTTLSALNALSPTADSASAGETVCHILTHFASYTPSNVNDGGLALSFCAALTFRLANSSLKVNPGNEIAKLSNHALKACRHGVLGHCFFRYANDFENGFYSILEQVRKSSTTASLSSSVRRGKALQRLTPMSTYKEIDPLTETMHFA